MLLTLLYTLLIIYSLYLGVLVMLTYNKKCQEDKISKWEKSGYIEEDEYLGTIVNTYKEKP